MDVLAELDEVQAKAPRGGSRCQTGEAIAALPPKDRAAFEDALVARRHSDPVVARVLEKRSGLFVSKHSVGNHRRGGCRCER